MTSTRPVRWAVLAVIIALYTAARLWRLTESCLWFDEIFSVHAAEHPWSAILGFVSLDLIHPPLFYIILKIWIAIGGEGLLWLRLLPVIFSLLAIFPFLALSRELNLKFPTQTLALFFLAVNGALIKYAQEVRMYSLLMCGSLFSIWLFARWFYRGKGLPALIVVNIVLVYTHYFGWFVIAAEVTAILILQRTKSRQAAAMFAVTAAFFLPWVFAVAAAASSGSQLGQNIGWIARPGMREIAVFVIDLVEPLYHQASSAEPSSIFRISVPLLLIALTAGLLYLIHWKKKDESERKNYILLLILTTIPLIAAFCASWLLSYSIWGTRHLIAIFAPCSILLALALSGIRTTKLKTALMTFVILLTGYAFILQLSRDKNEYSWCVWEQLANDWVTMPNYSSESKVVYALEELIGYHLWFAARDFSNNKINVVKGLGGSREDPAYFLPRGFDEVKIVDAETAFKGDEFWVAFRDPDPRHDSTSGMFSYQPRVLRELSLLGYEAEDARKIRVGNESAFLVKMLRRPIGIP